MSNLTKLGAIISVVGLVIGFCSLAVGLFGSIDLMWQLCAVMWLFIVIGIGLILADIIRILAQL